MARGGAPIYIADGMPRTFPIGRLRAAALTLAAGAMLACAASGGGRSARRTARLNAERRQAAALVEAGRSAQALQRLEPLMRELDGDPLVFVLAGRAYAALGRPREAVSAFEHAMRLDYARADAHLGLATVLMRTGRTGRALTEFELAVRRAPDDPVVHYDYGLALAELGRNREARAHWRRAAVIDPTDPRAAAALGASLAPARPVEALRWLDRADSLAGPNASTLDARGLALERLGRRRAARLAFARAVAHDPGAERFRFDLAACDLRAGRLDSALAGWNALVDRFGPRWSYRVYRARTLLAMGRADAVVAELARAVARADSIVAAGGDPGFDRTPPSLDEAWDVLALAWRERGELDRAVAAAERAVALAPRDPVRRVNLGVVLAAAGRIERAREQWRRALELDPGNAAARANLEALESPRR